MTKAKQTKWIYEVPCSQDWEQVVSALLAENPKITTWCFKGELGAGKTTCIQVLSQKLGIEESATSPTFSLVNTYKTKQGIPIYHADCYRINDAKEIASIGIDYYLDSEGYLLVEWPEKVFPYITEPYLLLHITNLDEGRKVVASLVNPNKS